MRLAAADERDRHADDRHHRQRRAAARIAIELGEHDAGHAHAAIELAGALDRVLPGHRVGDVEQVRRLHRVLDGLQFHHQVVVDVQTAGGVDDDGVEALGPAPRRARPSHAPPGPSSRAAYTFTPACSPTISSCWMAAGTPDVGGHHHRVACPAASATRPSLPDVVVLPAPCRPSSSTTRGFGASFVRPPSVPAKSASSSSRTIFTTCCAGDRLREHRLVHRPVAHAIDERLDDVEVDVGLEQRQADFAQHVFDLRLGEAHLAPEGGEGVLDAGAERVEHVPAASVRTATAALSPTHANAYLMPGSADSARAPRYNAQRPAQCPPWRTGTSNDTGRTHVHSFRLRRAPRGLAIAGALALSTGSLQAQNTLGGSIPGRSAVAAPRRATRPPPGRRPARTAGKPDFSGVWDHPYVPDMSRSNPRNPAVQKGPGTCPTPPPACATSRATTRRRTATTPACACRSG